MELSTTANLIAGGIEVGGDTIISGGRERVVGQNTKWYMRNKFLQMKHISKSSTADEKALLKIVGLKLPLTFGKKMEFYDDDKDDMPVKSKKKNSSGKHIKVMEVLKERLDDSADTITKRLITEYNLRAPLFWVLGDIVKFLAVVHKKKKPDSKKIKISPDMAVLIEKIWNGKNYFSYVVNSDDVPSNMMELMLYMLEIIKKIKPPMGKWVDPQLEMIKYPVIGDNIKQKIEEEKEKINKTNKNIDDICVVKEYIFTILTIENILIEFIDELEKYFIHLAKNMRKIFECLKKFFKSKNIVKIK
jgi:hypothetical protein